MHRLLQQLVYNREWMVLILYLDQFFMVCIFVYIQIALSLQHWLANWNNQMGYKFLVHPYHLHHHHLPQLFFVRLQLDDFIITANEIMGELLEDLLALYFFEHHLNLLHLLLLLILFLHYHLHLPRDHMVNFLVSLLLLLLLDSCFRMDFAFSKKH